MDDCPIDLVAHDGGRILHLVGTVGNSRGEQAATEGLDEQARVVLIGINPAHVERSRLGPPP